LTWRAATNGGARLDVSFHGELDLSVTEECSAGLLEPLAGAERTIVFDLGGLSFADSMGLRFLIDTKRQLESMGKRLLLGSVSAPVLKLFELAGLTQWFEYAEGHAPALVPCPMCEGDQIVGAVRCVRCGAALGRSDDGSAVRPLA
jgi:stage II sporulation protein AA (anti-sigma F factor antagonist)